MSEGGVQKRCTLMIVKKYSIEGEKTTTISKLCEITKKNERCWSLVAQLEMKAARITEKSNQ